MERFEWAGPGYVSWHWDVGGRGVGSGLVCRDELARVGHTPLILRGPQHKRPLPWEETTLTPSMDSGRALSFS